MSGIASKWVGIIAGGILAVLGLPITAHAEDRYNVLLIICDDLNDYQGVFGGHPQARAPNMDALADSGVVFFNAHSNAPICAPSRASMMTGIYPHNSGNYAFGKWFENPVLQNSKTLMQYVRENGYQALGTGKIMHHRVVSEWTEYGINNYAGPVAFNGVEATAHPSVPPAFSSIGLLDGTYASLADVPSVPAGEGYPGYTGWRDHNRGKPFRYVNDDDRDLMRDEEQAAWAVNKIEALDAQSGGDPFFLAVGFSKPHTPLVAPQKYFDMFPIETLQLPVRLEGDVDDCHYEDNFENEVRGRSLYEALRTSYPSVEDGLRVYLQAYLACVTFVDEQVGKVLRALEESRFSDNTVVILTSDHGYDHGQKEILYKNTLWETSTRIPLVIRVPGLEANAGKKVHTPVSLIDIYPTVVDLCNLEGDTRKNDQGAELDGHSLKPLLLEPEKEQWSGPPVAQSMVNRWGSTLPEAQHYAVKSQSWRYIRYQNGDEELYDHQSDPNEWINLLENADRVTMAKRDELKAALFELVPSLYTSEPFAFWLASYGLSDSGADSDEDGLVNLMEFGLGGSPLNPTNRGLTPTLHVQQTGIEFSFPLRDSEDLLYSLESTPGLKDGVWSGVGSPDFSEHSSHDRYFEPIPLPEPGEQGQVFLRLRVHEK